MDSINYKQALESLTVSRGNDSSWRSFIHLKAPAKLNLVLRIGGRRADGFHELKSLAVRMDFCDELFLCGRSDSDITFKCNRDDLCEIEDNLVYKAAKLITAECDKSKCGGADIELIKEIPDGAGLGGGSADAAMTLAGLNWMWGCGFDTERLMELAADLGSDVPLTLGSPACLMSGRGEKIQPVNLPEFAAIILCPPVHCPTGSVYGAFDAANPNASVTPADIDMDVFQNADVRQWDEFLVNDLAEPAMEARPELARWKNIFESACNSPTHVTGSGSALFCLFNNMADAQSAHKKMPSELAEISRPVRFLAS